MISILRHEIPHYTRRGTNKFHLNIHAGASIVQVAETTERVFDRVAKKEKTDYRVFLWAIEDTDIPAERRDFIYVQDGERLDWMGDDVSWRHIASFTAVGGKMWQHIFETTGLVVTEVQSGEKRPTIGIGNAGEEG